MLSNSFDLLEPTVIDNIDDNFLVIVTSNNQFIENFKKTDEWLEIEKVTFDVGIIDEQKLNEVKNYVYAGLKQKLINYDVNIFFPKSEVEIKMLNKFISMDYILHLKNNDIDEELDNFKTHTISTFDYFNSKLSVKIDKILKIDVHWFIPIEKQHIKIISNDYAGYKLIQGKDGNTSVQTHFESQENYDVNVINDDNIEFQILDGLLGNIIDFRYGNNIGIINDLLDSNLVTIKLYNLDLMKGNKLQVDREYIFSKNTVQKSLDNYIRDYEIMNNYFIHNKEQIPKWFDGIDLIEGGSLFDINSDSTGHLVLADINKDIDSLKENYEDIIKEYINGGKRTRRVLITYSYNLELLNVQDSIATAKITEFSLPYVTPKIGDGVYIGD